MKNVLLISVDCLRGDVLAACQPRHAGWAGWKHRLGRWLRHRHSCTPNLDSIASRGIMVQDVFTSAPFTPPAHASILTGLYPMHHGVRLLLGQHVRRDAPTIASVLRDAGYQTAAFPGVFVLNSETGILRGADYTADVNEGFRLRRRGHWRAGEKTVELLAEFLQRRDPARPFFAFVHLFDIHRTRQTRSLELPLREAYRRRLKRTDSEVVRPLLNVLRKMSLTDSTGLVVTADHGEALGGPEVSHGRTLFDATLRVPLVYALPWLGSPGRGVVVQKGVSRTIDIMPTLLALLGIEAPPTDGADLSEALLGGKTFPALDAYSETSPLQLYGGDKAAVKPFAGVELATIRTAGWRYIEGTAGSRALYRTGEMEEEPSDVAGSHSHVADKLSRRLRELGAWDKQEGDFDSRILDDEVMARLRDLGYA